MKGHIVKACRNGDKCRVNKRLVNKSRSSIHKSFFNWRRRVKLIQVMICSLLALKKCVFTHPPISIFQWNIHWVGQVWQDSSINLTWGNSRQKARRLPQAFINVLSINGMFKKIVLWLDNCFGENKNWTIFTMLVKIVHSNDNDIETISFEILWASSNVYGCG